MSKVTTLTFDEEELDLLSFVISALPEADVLFDGGYNDPLWFKLEELRDKIEGDEV